MIDLQEFFKRMIEEDVSDLHISAESPLHMRVDERLVPIDQQMLSAQQAQEMIYQLLKPEQIQRFEDQKELDCSFEIPSIGRFRMNVFYQRGAVGAAIRRIPFDIMNFTECGLPAKELTELCEKQRGLVLVTGTSGSGKTTSLASMIDYINTNRAVHIVTIEDPIEFVHENKKSLVDQREVHEDTDSFSSALRRVLRQDPDVVMVGELRDLETIRHALNTAETGHLVLATLHTSDAVQTINRIIDVFPAHQQEQVRTQFSFVLSAIISQQLLRRTHGSGRCLATEVLMASPAVRSLIREHKVHQLYSAMQTSQQLGMKTMNQSLADLCKQDLIHYSDARNKSSNPEELEKLLGL